MKIAIFGTYPPPIGGTSIHVKRLAELLQKKYVVNIYDTHGKSNDNNVIQIKNYKKFLLKYFFTGKEKIIHSHTHSWNERFILTLISVLSGKKIIFTYHSFRDELNKLSLIQKMSIRFVFKFANYHIAVNKEMTDKLIEWGAKKERIKFIPTFLLPSKNDNINTPSFLKDIRKNHKYIISGNASNNDKYNGQDLYGIDLCIELCYMLKKNYDICFVFAITKITDDEYYNKLNNRIKYLGLENNFIFINKNMSLIPILEISDIFIRPTNTDSFGISVGEALFLKVPTVASDVCNRINGTILFENRNIDDLYEKVKDIINNYKQNVELLEKLEVKDYSRNILDFYKTITD